MNGRGFFVGMVALMLLGVEISRGETPAVSVTLPRAEFNSILSRLDSVEQENRRLSAGYGELRRLPVSEISYFENAGGSAQQGCGNYGCKECGGQFCQPHGWYTGFEAMFIRPQWRESLAFEFNENSNETLVPFGFGFEFTPRVTLGYTACNGMGIRARYLGFDHDRNVSFTYDGTNTIELQAFDSPDIDLYGRIIAENNGDTLTASYDLEFGVLDTEITQSFQHERTELVVGCGLRHARIKHHTFGEVRDISAVLDQRLDHTNEFEGIGPLLSLELWRPIRRCNGLSLYCNTRGSILFGDSDQRIVDEENLGGTPSLSIDSRSEQGVMTIMELGLGIEWTRELPRYSSTLFLRGGYEGQYWLDAGGPAYPTNNMGLQGLIFNVGVTR